MSMRSRFTVILIATGLAAMLAGCTLVDDNLATVLGVDVATDPALIGKPVVVVGLLEKWIITKRLLEIGHADVEPFKSRGPGTYYRLVDPYTGRLAQPKLDDEAEEDQGEQQD